MRWLQGHGHLNLEVNLLGNESARGSALQEVGILYLLRALCDPDPFTMDFDFQYAASWAKEMAYSIARLDNVDAAVDVLGGALENPDLNVVHTHPIL